ncbi:MAG: hypothetical protein QOD00_1359 [Blastocatellia bacterium]|jgi:predicted membrane protein|nr:hypothetical protein [Blastocatellia bacterium]
MLALLKIASRWGGILTLIVLLIALVRQLISLVTFFLFALKIGVVVVFVLLMLLIVVLIFRSRGQRRREEAEGI